MHRSHAVPKLSTRRPHPRRAPKVKAGTPNGHHFVNRSATEARFLVVGTRVAGDVATYPDDDIMWCQGAAGSYVAHKNGAPYGG